MKVLVAKEPGIAAYTEEYAKPVPKDDEVVIKVYRNGVCATDLEILSGHASFMNDGSTSYPVRFGHEYSGIVDGVGKDVTKFKVGDHVIGEGTVTCGKCEACLAGRHTECPAEMHCVGTIRTWPGSYAEYLVLPERHVIHVPDGISHDVAALAEPCAIAMTGVNKGHIVPGESYVLVPGVGAIGIAAAAFAKWKGAKKVIISGRTPYKLDIAKKMGVDVVCNVQEEDLVECVMRETDGHGVDCIIECSGNVSVLDDCFKVLAQHGTFVGIAFYGQKYNWDMDYFILKDARFESVTNHAYADVLKAISDGVDVSPLITRHIKFDEAAEVMMQQIKEKSGDIKIMVDFE